MLSRGLSRNAKFISSKQKILLMGHPGTRKTSSLIELAVAYPDVNVFLIDPDDGVPKLVEVLFGGWANVPNLHYYPVSSWTKEPDDDYFLGVRQAYAEIQSLAKPGDWIGIDMAGKIWQYVRDWYDLKIYGATENDMKIQRREDNGEEMFGGLSSNEWKEVKGELDQVLWHAVKRLPCNVVIASGVKQIPVKKDGSPLYPGTDERFLKLGVAPDVEKRLPYEMDTIISLTAKDKIVDKKLHTEWSFRTIGKDRNGKVGPIAEGLINNGLWIDYAIAVGIDPTSSPGKEA